MSPRPDPPGPAPGGPNPVCAAPSLGPGPARLWLAAYIDPSEPARMARRFYFADRAFALAASEGIAIAYKLEDHFLDYTFTGPADRVAALLDGLQAAGCDALGVVDVGSEAELARFEGYGVDIEIDGSLVEKEKA